MKKAIDLDLFYFFPVLKVDQAVNVMKVEDLKSQSWFKVWCEDKMFFDHLN